MNKLVQETEKAGADYSRWGKAIVLGQMLLGLICVASTYVVTKIVQSSTLRVDDEVWVVVMVIAIGCVGGTVGVISVWLALAPMNLLRRALTTFLGLIAAVCAMGLAMLFYWPSNQPLSQNEDLWSLYLFGYAVPTILGASVPLLILRYGFGRVMVKSNEGPAKPNLSIRDLLLTTALVGAIILSIQITKYAFIEPGQGEWRDDLASWRTAGIFFGIAAGISLLSLLPGTLLILSNRKNNAAGFIITIMISSVLISATYFVMIAMGATQESVYFCWALFVFVLNFSLTCGGFRLWGYRIQKPT